MSNTAIRQALEWEAETTFGEDATTFATGRVAIIAPVDVSGIKQDKLDPQRLTQRMQEGTPHILGPQEGSFKTRMWLTGHGSTMVGSPSIATHETFLSYVFGKPGGSNGTNGRLSATASTTFTGAGTVAAPTTTASGTFSAGSLVRGGVKGLRADGQMYPVSTHAATTLNMLIELAALPANTDVLLPCVNFFFPEDPSGTDTNVTGLRFRWRTANLAMEFHGCFPTAVEIGGLNTKEIPYIDITWEVSWWRYTATSGVSSVASNEFNPAPVAAGSFAINDVGTATRATRTIRDFKISIALGMERLLGPGGVNANMTIVGAKRTPSSITVSWVEDADAATATPVLDGYFTASTRKHVMYTLSTTDGSAVGFYFPSLCISGARPVQINNGNINRLAIQAEAYTGATTTSELTLSAMRMGFA